MESKIKKSLLSVSGILVLLVILLVLNGIFHLSFGKFYADLTDDGLYSLSDGTKKLLTSIEDPITLRFYFSETESAKVPAIRLYGDRIRDLLTEYQRRSKGKINLKVENTRPDTEEEEWAEKYGLNPLKLASGETIYFGLAGSNGLGDEASIPMFNLQRQEFLEYDISKMIYTLIQSKKPVVAILSSINVRGMKNNPYLAQQMGQQNQPWVFTEQLAELAELKYLEATTDKIADNIDILLLIHPKNLNDKTLYAIDQFVMRGGKLITFVDPYCEADRPISDPQNPMAGMMSERSSNLNRLLSSWGVEMVEKKAVADLSLATKVNIGPGQPPANFILWLSLPGDNMDKSNVATSVLNSVLMAWPGALRTKSVEGVTIEPLISSSDRANLIEEMSYRFGGGEPQEVLKKFVPGHEKQILAAKISGKLKSNFPDGQPKGDKEEENKDDNVNQSVAPQAGHLTESKESSTVIVVADVDMLSDPFSVISQNIFGQKLVSLLNDNLNLLQNLVENLSGSEDLIGMRSRGRFSRPFTKVQQLEEAAALRWQQEEQRLQAELTSANQRLQQLESASDRQGSQQVLNKAVFEEIKKFREQRKIAQQRLRAVRRNLRQDVESLGNYLFLANTFLIPLLLVIGGVLFFMGKRKRPVVKTD